MKQSEEFGNGGTADLAWARIGALEAIVRAHRKEGEALRRQPDAVAEAFLALDLYRLMVPQDLGGSGVDLATAFDLAVEVASWDGSAGWNFSIGCGALAFFGALPLDRIVDIFSTADCAMAGTGSPPGKARVVDGGFLLTGRWPWASAIHQAKWAMGPAFLFDDDTQRVDAAGRPELGFFVVPTEQATILDTWYSEGLRGTGSTDWQASDLFVPDHHVSRRAFSGESEHEGVVFRLPATFFGILMVGTALGIAKSAVVDLIAVATREGSPLRQQTHAQFAVAKAQALYEAGHLTVRESARSIWNNAAARQVLTLEERARIRRSYVHAVDSSVEAVRLCNAAAGGAAVFEDAGLGRALRDVHAVQAHRVLSGRFLEIAGQAAFGLPVDNPLF